MVPTSDPIVPNVRRRLFIRAGLASVAAVAAAGAAGVELVSRGVLPGKGMLDAIDGACSVTVPDRTSYAEPGPSVSGTFYSAARRRTVGYTIAYPPGRRPGDRLPLVVMLHGFGADHADALSGMSPAQAVALRVDGAPLAPMAMVTADGGGGYWNPHPGDDPMAMLTGELIPMCRRLGLGRPPHRIGAMGISMGGYGALLLAEKHPGLIAAVAAISPAIWTSYAQARAANAGAYASAADFAADDAVTPRRRARARAGPRRGGLRRPVLPRRPRTRRCAARRRRRGLRRRLPHRPLLRGAATAVARVPGPPPQHALYPNGPTAAAADEGDQRRATPFDRDHHRRVVMPCCSPRTIRRR